MLCLECPRRPDPLARAGAHGSCKTRGCSLKQDGPWATTLKADGRREEIQTWIGPGRCNLDVRPDRRQDGC
eukprot:364516-Chlamydomonas_euryale.AAC.9